MNKKIEEKIKKEEIKIEEKILEEINIENVKKTNLKKKILENIKKIDTEQLRKLLTEYRLNNNGTRPILINKLNIFYKYLSTILLILAAMNEIYSLLKISNYLLFHFSPHLIKSIDFLFIKIIDSTSLPIFTKIIKIIFDNKYIKHIILWYKLCKKNIKTRLLFNDILKIMQDTRVHKMVNLIISKRNIEEAKKFLHAVINEHLNNSRFLILVPNKYKELFVRNLTRIISFGLENNLSLQNIFINIVEDAPFSNILNLYINNPLKLNPFIEKIKSNVNNIKTLITYKK